MGRDTPFKVTKNENSDTFTPKITNFTNFKGNYHTEIFFHTFVTQM